MDQDVTSSRDQGGVHELAGQNPRGDRRYQIRESGSSPGPKRLGADLSSIPDSLDGTRQRKLKRRQMRLESRRRRLRYLVPLAVAVLLAFSGISLVLGTQDRALVQAVAVPVASQPIAAPDEPDPPESPSSEKASATRAHDTKDSDLAGNPAALEKRIEEIAIYYGGVYGVNIYDPSSGGRATLGSDETFFAASIGKLPTLLALYKSAAEGQIDLDGEITMQASDVQSYGTGVLHTYEVGHTLTLRECAFHLMNDSDNTAWKMLTRYLGEQNIQAVMNDIRAYDTEYWVPNTTTANDVSLMLQKIADPAYTSLELSQEMLSTMTDTFSEDRIPAGLPQDVQVAHKIGTYENNFSDAGIVTYKSPDGSEKQYFIVVFTDGMGETSAQAAIQEISTAAHQTFGPTDSTSE